MITPAAAYAVLALPYGAPRSDVKAAYRRLVRRWHPDHNNASAESTRVTQMLNDAREVLLLPDQVLLLSVPPLLPTLAASSY
jgi:DnaJ-class molecular chaperone